MEDINTNLLTALQVLMLLVGSIGAVGNVLVCVTIIYTKTLHSVTNLMILNLAVADALVSVFFPLQSFIAANNLPTNMTFSSNSGKCTANILSNSNSQSAYFFLTNCFNAHSVLSLTLANYERFIGISRPLQYTTYFTRRKTMLLLFAVWVTPVLVQMPHLILLMNQYQREDCISEKSHRLLVAGIAEMLLRLLPIAATIWMYIRILVNLKQGARRLEEQGIQGPAQELHRAHKKVTKTLGIITTAFFILVMPGAIWYSISTITGSAFNFSHFSHEVMLGVFSLLCIVNSAINPVLYGFKYNQLRKAFITMVRRCNQQRQPNQVGPM